MKCLGKDIYHTLNYIRELKQYFLMVLAARHSKSVLLQILGLVRACSSQIAPSMCTQGGDQGSEPSAASAVTVLISFIRADPI